MVFLTLRIKNLYCFKDTKLDFTCSKDTGSTVLKNEPLKGLPEVQFKRINVLIGSNASGKTSLARIMYGISGFLSGGDLEYVKDGISTSEGLGSIEVTYITPHTSEIHHLELEINLEGISKEVHRKEPLVASKPLIKTLEDIYTADPTFYYDSEHLHNVRYPEFKSVGVATGQVGLVGTNNTYHYLINGEQVYWSNTIQEDIKVLKKILQYFDPSISNVLPIKGLRGTYVIKFENGDSIIAKQEHSTEKSRERLSKGTQEAIKVASLVSTVRNSKDLSTTFFLDGGLGYAHPLLENTILGIVIGNLNPYSQLFYTTHTYENLKHSIPNSNFTFLQEVDGIKESSQ